MASRAPIDQNLLADLVERRMEAPDVEYKNFMPLTENVERAKIARHICALANSGGGWLIFGFENDGSPVEPHPPSLAAYDQDAINGIGARYLEPQPHCETHFVTAASGRTYPVVRVPSHGNVPICAKADGPHEKNGPQGIRKGFHYIRAPGPQSVPIDSPELWRDLLRRCVLAERTNLLASIGQLFDRPQPAASEASPIQAVVHHTSESWQAMEAFGWPVDPGGNHALFAFRFSAEDGSAPAPLPLGALERAIRSASSVSSDLTGESIGAFDPGWGMENRAKVTLLDDRDAYRGRRTSPAGSYDLPMDWFIRDDGVGAEITAIPEDNPWTTEAVEGRGRTRPWPPGKRFAPSFQIEMMAQRVVFVRSLAENYPDAARCELLVRYRGLAGRELDEPAPGVHMSLHRSSDANEREVNITVGIAALASELAEVTALLIGPIFRLFDGWEVGPDAVRAKLRHL
jgi:hypothetical protein